MKIPWWIKAALTFYAAIEFFTYEKLEDRTFDDRTRSFRHFNTYTKRLERTYGKVIYVGAQAYTLYYRLWFKPFKVRDWPMFDTFTDPWKGQAIFLELWSLTFVNPLTKKEVPFEAVSKIPYKEFKKLLEPDVG